MSFDIYLSRLSSTNYSNIVVYTVLSQNVANGFLQRTLVTAPRAQNALIVASRCVACVVALFMGIRSAHLMIVLEPPLH